MKKKLLLMNGCGTVTDEDTYYAYCHSLYFGAPFNAILEFHGEVSEKNLNTTLNFVAFDNVSFRPVLYIKLP